MSTIIIVDMLREKNQMIVHSLMYWIVDYKKHACFTWCC